MNDYEDFEAREGRLIVLLELAKQVDGRRNEIALTKVLDVVGYRRSREWVRTQLRKLVELGAVTTVDAGTVMIAEITRAGLDHVERRSIIDGIDRPSPGV